MPPLTETVVLQPLIAVGEDAETGGKPRRPQRRSYARIQDAIEVPKLIETQIDSFETVQARRPARALRRDLADRGFYRQEPRPVLSRLQV